MRILFSSSDAGGANSILSIVNLLRENGDDLMFAIDGPSIGLFRDKKINFISGSGLEDGKLGALVEKFKPEVFVSGTSLGYSIEKKLLVITRKKKIRSISIMDSWHNYWQKFSGAKKDFKYLPDFICAPDKEAKREMIREGFDSKIIKVTGNPYFEVFLRKVRIGRTIRNKILFISQPISALNKNRKINNYGYDEIRTVADIIAVLKSIGFDGKFCIRAHPSESEKKFEQFLGERPFSIYLDRESVVETSVSESGLIIGMTSIVLFLAQTIGKHVISYQPGASEKISRNRYRFGELISNKEDLEQELKGYLIGKNGNAKKEIKLVKNAAANVVGIIHSL